MALFFSIIHSSNNHNHNLVTDELTKCLWMQEMCLYQAIQIVKKQTTTKIKKKFKREQFLIYHLNNNN